MVLSLLWRFLSMYWLKPFDAVNDAANAWSLRQFPWEPPILEIGGGDGVFSFIMHGGAFAFGDDRYDQADPRREGDIFDVYRSGQLLTVQRPAVLRYEVGVDLKWSHLLKAGETHLYHNRVLSWPEPLPFASRSFKTVFLYFPHGLIELGKRLDYRRVLDEVHRVLVPGGTLVMTAVNYGIRRFFVCHPLRLTFERRGWRRLAAYFAKLDAGRYEELTGLGLSRTGWEALLDNHGFSLVGAWTQVRPFAWRLYDMQTRPMLRSLIHWNLLMRRLGLKQVAKALWISCWLPVVIVVYFILARPRPSESNSDKRAGVFFAFRAVAT